MEVVLPRRTRSFPLALALALGALVFAAPGANAGLLVSSAENCETQTLETPFSRWHDGANYTLAKNGTFEAGSAGWELKGGASVVSGNEPWNVHGAGESRSLRLPRGSSATSSPICVGLEHPTIRFFAKSTTSGLTGALLSSLRVDVLFEDNAGNVHALPTLLPALANSRWHPTLPMLVVANLLPLLPGEKTAVAFRIVPQGPGTWDVDDFYVDPRGRR
jgi:hypothetical protein